MIPLYDHNPTHRTPYVTFLLIAVNVFVYFFWQTQVGLRESLALAAFVPAELTHHVPGATTHLITAMFMHGGFMHLLGNMWFLWIFGDNVENACGSFGFVSFYILSGVAATLGYTLLDPNSSVPLVGASGAISGVLGGYLVKHPMAPVRTLIPFGIFTRIIDLPAFVFLFIWIGMQILSQAAMAARHTQTGGGVAYVAHIAGFIAGVVLIFLFEKRQEKRSRNRWDVIDV